MRAKATTTRLMLPSQLQHSNLRFVALLLGTLVVGALIVVCTEHFTGPAAVPLVALLFLALLYVVGSVRTKVVIGGDGLQVRWLGWRRFVAYRDVLDVRTEGRMFGSARQLGVILTVRGERDLLLVCSIVDRRKLDAVAKKIKKAKNAMGQSSNPIALLSLHRGAASPEEWLAALAGVCERTSYRANALGKDAFWEVVENANQPALDRAAAAFVLRPHLDAAGRERLREVAQTTAQVELQQAFECLADGDDQGIEQALLVLAKKDAGNLRPG